MSGSECSLNLEDKKILFEKYKHDIDTHRGYLDLTLKANVFFYAVTGAILSYYFAHNGDHEYMEYSLLFPVVMSFFFGLFFLRGSKLSENSQMDIEYMAGALGFKTYSAIGVTVGELLRVSSWLFMLSSIGILILFIVDSGALRWICKAS